MSASQFPVEAGHIMMFARAIGDHNPVYHDAVAAKDSEVGSIIAPPTFVQASAQYDPDYSLRPRPGGTWFGSGRTPSGLRDARSAQSDSARSEESNGGTFLHAEQHYEYHRPLRAGDVLAVSVHPGATWEKQGRRGGLLQFVESIVEYRNPDGDLVVTARSIGVRTQQTVKDSS